MSHEILRHVYWAFGSETCPDAYAFNEAVTAYNTELNADLERPNDNWQPDAVVIDSPACYLRYEAWFNAAPELLANEQLTDPDTFSGADEDGYHEAEILARLDADNGKTFTALEFLYKAHQQMAGKEMGDHVFFEGAEREETLHKGLPVYAIYCGS